MDCIDNLAQPSRRTVDAIAPIAAKERSLVI
jgi:hypothetical protein